MIVNDLTGNAGGPGSRNIPDPTRQAGQVPVGLRPVAGEEDGIVGTGVACVGEEGHQLAVPVRGQTSRGRRLKGTERHNK